MTARCVFPLDLINLFASATGCNTMPGGSTHIGDASRYDETNLRAKRRIAGSDVTNALFLIARRAALRRDIHPRRVA